MGNLYSPLIDSPGPGIYRGDLLIILTFCGFIGQSLTFLVSVIICGLYHCLMNQKTV